MVAFRGKALRELAGVSSASAAEPAEQHHHDPEGERRGDPAGPEPDVRVLRQRDPERERAECSDVDEQDTLAGKPEQEGDLTRTPSPERGDLGDTGDGGPGHEE